ncbi:MAG: hypothetical protein RLZZ453_741 [Chlamydiota bacterium]|jgi:hypothetical protein
MRNFYGIKKRIRVYHIEMPIDPPLIRGLKKIASYEGCISCEKLLSFFNHKGPFLLLTIISAFFCIPLSIPGLSTPFGLLIAWISLHTFLGKQNYPLPKWVLKKRIPLPLAHKASQILIRLFLFLRPLIHARCQALTRWPTFSVSLTFILGLLLALPLPIPGTNLFTAIPLFLISLSTLEEDGLLLLLGYLTAFFSLALFTSLFFFGAHFL